MSISMNETASIALATETRLMQDTSPQKMMGRRTWTGRGLVIIRSLALSIVGSVALNVASSQTVLALYYNSAGTTLLNAGLDAPYGIAVDSSNNIYVSSFFGATVSKYSSSGGLSWSKPDLGSNQSGINFAGIAITSGSDVLVADVGASVVRRFSSSGALLSDFASSGLSNPFGIAIDNSGNVFVTNTNADNPTVMKYSSGGALLSTFASSSSGLSNPFGIAIDSSGNVLIGDIGKNRVAKYNSSGVLLGTFALGSTPYGIAIDSSGDILIADINGTVMRYDSTGVLRQTLDGFAQPVALAIDSNSRLLVADFGNDTVSRFTPTPEPITPVPFGFSPLWGLLPASIRYIVKRLPKRN